MEVFETKQALSKILSEYAREDKTIGFVPTMGALHEGHLSLIRCSKEQDDITVVSIFVNPTQFNHQADYEKYPRLLDEDLQILEKEGCNIVFTPSEKEMYPEEDIRVFDFGELDKVMEGYHRPGHFNGVAQIVSKFFETIEPHRVYFGDKDFQQLVIIRKLVEKMNMTTEIVPCPIMRENNGLAMSSRNKRLSKEERDNAAMISQVLFKVQKIATKYTVEEVKEMVVEELNKNPYIDVEYFEIVNEENLKPIEDWSDTYHKRACIAAWVGYIRLIDNVKFYF
ncbi:MAG: pantoate--beta-alanine ligase [Bacteroidales bacterium]